MGALGGPRVELGQLLELEANLKLLEESLGENHPQVQHPSLHSMKLPTIYHIMILMKST